MKLKTLIITSIGALTISIANAGDSKGVVCPVEEPFGATLSAGYDSHYIFRGVDNGQNAISVGLDYDLDLLPIPVTLGAHYINPTDGSLVNPTHSDELQLSAAVGQSFGSVDAWLGYTAYLFPENGGRTAGDSTNEIGVGAGTSVGIIDLNAGAY
ncbi:MAG: hypothetical protein KDM91_20760, partial [Verrucomicrobiae bacterium]|nr:hypothetical protein [Verrucomicrobiae bacterium]